MQTTVITSLSYEELKTLISEALRKELKQIAPPPRMEELPGQAGEAYVNKRQAAKLLSCSPSTIDNHARARNLTRHYVGKAVRFDRQEVLALAKRHTSTKQRINNGT